MEKTCAKKNVVPQNKSKNDWAKQATTQNNTAHNNRLMTQRFSKIYKNTRATTSGIKYIDT